MNQTRKPWPIVAMLCATATAGYICRVNVSTAGVLIMEEFKLSQADMGRIFSAFLLGYALFQIPSGTLADRWGARRVLSIASWLWAILTAIQIFLGRGMNPAASLFIFLIFRFMLGISASPAYPASAQGVSRWVLPEFQGRANGIVIASIGLGSAIAPPLVSNIMVHWGWRIALLISSLPALIIAFLWLKIKVPPDVNVLPTNQTLSKHSSPEKKLLSKNFLLLSVSYTLQGYVGYIFVSWFYLYLVQERHFSLLNGAWVSSLPWILSILSIPLGGFVSDRLSLSKFGPLWGRRIVPIIGMAFSGILISIGAHTGNAIVAAISLAFATAFVLCVEGPFWTMMMSLSGNRSGTAGGIMNMGSNLGGLLSPLLTPIIAAAIGWENALHIAAVLAIISALLWLGISPAFK